MTFKKTISIDAEDIAYDLVDNPESLVAFLKTLADAVADAGIETTLPNVYVVAGRLRTIATDTEAALKQSRAEGFKSAISDVLDGISEDRSDIAALGVV